MGLLRGKICSHTRCMCDDLERRSPPELSQRTVSSNPEAARRPRTTMKYQPFSAVQDHSCNLDSTFLLVAMYKSICICGCQWGVYASTWPIKKKKKMIIFNIVLNIMQNNYYFKY